MASPQMLNDIGPGVMVESRSGSWSVRFRLPKAIQEQYSLPRLPRLITNNIRGNLSDPERRATALGGRPRGAEERLPRRDVAA